MQNQPIKELEKYIKDILAITLVIKPWNGQSDLPFFLRDKYDFFHTELMALPCIFILAKDINEATPALVRKHIDLLRPKTFGKEIIYVQKQLSSFNRKRLIEQKVCFVIPGNQMYLPFLGIDFREHFKKLQPKLETLSPSAQIIILGALLKGQQEVLWLYDLSRQYGYSVMTISRAFSEIESLGLAEISSRVRRREMILKGTKKEVWEKSIEFLRNPIIQRLYLDRSVMVPNGIFAGRSALARYSSLAEPVTPVWAVSRGTARELRLKYRTDEFTVKDLDCNEIEVWSYDPKIFATNGVVDKLSLYLSLKEMQDERIQIALVQMMREMRW
jgi:hypothetical protein